MTMMHEGCSLSSIQSQKIFVFRKIESLKKHMKLVPMENDIIKVSRQSLLPDESVNKCHSYLFPDQMNIVK